MRRVLARSAVTCLIWCLVLLQASSAWAQTIIANQGTPEQAARFVDLWPSLSTGHARLDDEDGRVLGSAIIIFPGDVAVTAAHVIELAVGTPTLVSRHDRVAVDKVAGIDAARDIAVLCLARSPGMAARLRPVHLKNGLVVAVGSDRGEEALISIGHLDHAVEQSRAPRAVAMIAGRPGFSGGPVLTARGELMGMLTAVAHDEPKSLIVPAATLHAVVSLSRNECQTPPAPID